MGRKLAGEKSLAFSITGVKSHGNEKTVCQKKQDKKTAINGAERMRRMKKRILGNSGLKELVQNTITG